MLIDPITSFIELILQIHDVKCVQCIDNCQAKAKPIVISFGNWLEIVVTPCEFFVPFPCMFECFDGSTLSLVCGSLKFIFVFKAKFLQTYFTLGNTNTNTKRLYETFKGKRKFRVSLCPLF